MVAGIEQALETAPDGLAALVVEGEGGVFSAGADLKSLSAALAKPPAPGEADPLQALNAAGGRFFARFACAPFVTIAVVDGAAVGGGMGLAAAADIVLATPRARFALTETSLGIPPAQIAPYLVARLGERVSAASRADRRAARRSRGGAVGLADFYCDSDEERDARLAALLKAIERCAPGANAETKRLFRACRAEPPGRLYRDGGAELRFGLAWARGAGRARGLRRQARAFLGEGCQMSARFSVRPHRQSRRDRLPDHPRRARRGPPRHRRLQRRRRQRAARSARRRCGPHRSVGAGSVLSLDRRADRRGEGHRRRSAASGLRLSRRERRPCGGLRRRRTRVRRAAARRDPRHGRQERGEDANGGGGRPLRARLPWRRPERGALRHGGGAHRLSGHGQGDRGRRRARHAHRARARSPRGGATPPPAPRPRTPSATAGS